MTTHILTEAEKEAKYDAERAGTLYVVAPVDYETQRAATFQKLDAIAARVATPAAPASAVRMVNWYRDPNNGDDLTEKPCGPLAFIDYVCGTGDAEALISLDAHKGTFEHVRLARETIDSLDSLQLAMPNMFAILADPRVQALRRGSAVCLTPAIEVERMYHDPSKRGDLTDQPVGPLAYIDYILGKDDMRACVSHDLARGPMVELCNGDLISLDDAERYCHNLLALLADPRVQAARAEVVNEHR